MKLSVRPALTTAAVVRGLDTDHDRRRGQRCILLNRPVSLINRGKPVQINRATSDPQKGHPPFLSLLQALGLGQRTKASGQLGSSLPFAGIKTYTQRALA